MGPVIAGPFLAVSALLAAAGIAKLAGDLRSRALGSAEIAVGIYALVAGDRLGAGLVAIAFAAFTVVVATRWARSGGTASCECFGARPSPATPVHALADAACALVATAAALAPPGSLGHVVGAQPVAGAPFLIASATVAYLMFTVMTAEVRP